MNHRAFARHSLCMECSLSSSHGSIPKPFPSWAPPHLPRQCYLPFIRCSQNTWFLVHRTLYGHKFPIFLHDHLMNNNSNMPHFSSAIVSIFHHCLCRIDKRDFPSRLHTLNLCEYNVFSHTKLFQNYSIHKYNIHSQDCLPQNIFFVKLGLVLPTHCSWVPENGVHQSPERERGLSEVGVAPKVRVYGDQFGGIILWDDPPTGCSMESATWPIHLL
jgi:hypothetical protein